MKTFAASILVIQIITNISCKSSFGLDLENYDIRKVTPKYKNRSALQKRRILHRLVKNDDSNLDLNGFNIRKEYTKNLAGVKRISKRLLHNKNVQHLHKVKKNGNFVRRIPAVHTVKMVATKHPERQAEQSVQKAPGALHEIYSNQKIQKMMNIYPNKRELLFKPVKSISLKWNAPRNTKQQKNDLNLSNGDEENFDTIKKIQNEKAPKNTVSKSKRVSKSKIVPGSDGSVFSDKEKQNFDDIQKLIKGDKMKNKPLKKKIPSSNKKKVVPVPKKKKVVAIAKTKKKDIGAKLIESTKKIDDLNKALNVKDQKLVSFPKNGKNKVKSVKTIPKKRTLNKVNHKKDLKRVLLKSLTQKTIIPKAYYQLRNTQSTTTASNSDSSSSSTPFVCPTGNEGLYKRNQAVTPKDIIKVINLVRTQPRQFAETIKKLYLDPVDDNGRHCKWGITFREGKAGGQHLYDYLLTKEPEQPIYGNGCLIVTAYTHSEYMADNSQIEHTEKQADGSLIDLLLRVEKWGKFNLAAESLGTLMLDHFNAESFVGHLLLDDGITGKVNRVNLLKSGWHSIGVGLMPNGSVKYYTVIYASNYICTMENNISHNVKQDAVASEFFGGQKSDLRQLSGASSLLKITVSSILVFLTVLLS